MSIRPTSRVSRFRKTLIRRMFEAAPTGTVNLGLGEPPGPTPEAVAAGGLQAVRNGETGYSPTAGRRDLQEAIAAACTGRQVSPGDVVVTAGSQEALFAALMLFLEPGREVLVPDPGYPAYPNIVELLGGVPRRYPLDPASRYRLNADDLLGRVTAATCAVVLNGPANPTGAIPAGDQMERLAAGLAARSIPFISDEIYAGLSWKGMPLSPAEFQPAGGIVIGGLSKTHAMTGWRIGWAIAPPALAGPLAAVHQHLVTCAPSVSQGAALAAFSTEGREAADRIRNRLARGREFMDRELRSVPGIDYHRPDGGFYYFVEVSGCTDSEQLARSILEQVQVLTIPGSAFGPGGEGCLRLSFSASENDIAAGIAGVRKVLAV